MTHTFDVEFIVRTEATSLEDEEELKRICEEIESRSKRFKIVESCYTININKQSLEGYKFHD